MDDEKDGRGGAVGIHRFDLGGRGLTRVLGKLESRVMETIWKLGIPTGNEICDALGPGAQYKTVLTVANRMVKKGLLTREPTSGRAFRYRATVSREAFLDRIAGSVASELVGDFGRPALAQLVQAADKIDPSYLDELERLVRERKEER